MEKSEVELLKKIFIKNQPSVILRRINLLLLENSATLRENGDGDINDDLAVGIIETTIHKLELVER